MPMISDTVGISSIHGGEDVNSTVEIAAARTKMVCWYRSHDRATLLRHVQTAAMLAAGAREGVANLKRAGLQVALVSITWQFAVEWLATELGADWAVGTQWCANDEIVHFWPADKAGLQEQRNFQFRPH